MIENEVYVNIQFLCEKLEKEGWDMNSIQETIEAAVEEYRIENGYLEDIDIDDD